MGKSVYDLYHDKDKDLTNGDVKYKYTYKCQDLSYLFMQTKYADSIKRLIFDSKNNHTITYLHDRKYENITPYNSNNYHINQKSSDGSTNISDDIQKEFIQLNTSKNYEQSNAFCFATEPDRKYSTGLWEYLIKYIQNNKKTEVTITVCGLVGNISVMYTVMYGSAMLNSYESELRGVTVKFIYQLFGTLFLCDDGKSFNGDFKLIKYDKTIANSYQNLLVNDRFVNSEILAKSQNLLKYFKEKAQLSTITQCNFVIMLDDIKIYDFNIMPHTEHTEPPIVVGGGNIYKQKYLKYKQKYLELKNQNYL